MTKLLVFVVFSLPIVWLSRRSLFSLRHHGLYRLVSWECIMWILINNYSFWFTDPFSTTQIASWILLLLSLGLAISGAGLMKKIGGANASRTDDSLYRFERTTQLIETGIFRYVRHPLYSSLIFLTWGIFFKNINPYLFAVSMMGTISLFMTALVEEREDVKYFGNKYLDYMKRTKMFVPLMF
jgi:protein-S-isoprenylcysteine O-methyltransferase Ste14